jgi:Putative Actinobacterial Holin-X, holin superfamily III
MTIQHDIKTSQNDLRTISTLVADAMGQFAKLFQNEIDLAKAELSDRVQKITGAAGFIAGGPSGDPRHCDGAVRIVGGVDLRGMVATAFLPDIRDPRWRHCGRAVCGRHQSDGRP